LDEHRIGEEATDLLVLATGCVGRSRVVAITVAIVIAGRADGTARGPPDPVDEIARKFRCVSVHVRVVARPREE
jgi:hypothetical protein